MKRLITNIALIVGLSCLLIPNVLAQKGGLGIGDPSAQLQAELERTDQVIERARSTVNLSSHELIIKTLEFAEELQRKAKEYYYSKMYAESLKFTREARNQAQKALSNGDLDNNDIGSVESRLERAGQLLEQVRETLQQHRSHRLQTLFDAAQQNLRRGWDFYRSEQFYRALKFSREVEKAVQKIRSIATQRLRLVQNFEHRAERLQELLVNLRTGMASCDQAGSAKLLQQARTSHQLAMDLARQDQIEAAMQTLQSAHHLALEAKRQCGQAGELEKLYMRTSADFQIMLDRGLNNNGNTERLVNQVKQQLQMARDFLDNEQSDQASASLRAASLGLNQLRRLQQSSGE